MFSQKKQPYHFFNKSSQSIIEIVLPDPVEVKLYAQTLSTHKKSEVFWTKIWPSSIALSQYLWNHSNKIQHKKVFEVAAGIGLPSKVSAQFAEIVYCSEYEQEALKWMNYNFANDKRVVCLQANWNQLPLSADVYLWSDVNYNIQHLPSITHTIETLLLNNKQIILSTPTRNVGHSFIQHFKPFVSEHQLYTIKDQFNEHLIAVYLLKLNTFTL